MVSTKNMNRYKNDISRRSDGIIPNRVLDPNILDTETRSNINDGATPDEEAQYLKMQDP